MLSSALVFWVLLVQVHRGPMTRRFLEKLKNDPSLYLYHGTWDNDFYFLMFFSFGT